MLRLASLTALSLALVACNQGRTGANDTIEFTPLECGNALLGCDFDRSLALWADTYVQIAGVDGYPTAGLDLASRDPAVLVVSRVADVGGRPTWNLHGAGEGVAQLAAVDSGGAEIDFTEVAVRKAARLGLVKVLGDAVGPTVNGTTEEWTVNANQPVSLQAQLMVDASAVLMGRIGYTVTVPAGSHLLDSELGGSARDKGYLYVQPPAGSYPFSFELAVDPTIKVDALLKAQ